MTLNPYYGGNNLNEMISQDRFILNKFDHWYFGQDDTGDIKNFDNYLGLISHCKSKFESEVRLIKKLSQFICDNILFLQMKSTKIKLF